MRGRELDRRRAALRHKAIAIGKMASSAATIEDELEVEDCARAAAEITSTERRWFVTETDLATAERMLAAAEEIYAEGYTRV